MTSGILAILDDIALLMDDVVILSKVATKKTIGILADDLAYTQAYSGQVKIALEIQGPQAWMRRRPCGSGTITTHHSGERVSGYFYRYLFEAYSKSRNLNGIYMFVRARAEITPPGQPTVIKYTNWTGRNVNTPY